jgi:hypothetical protein
MKKVNNLKALTIIFHLLGFIIYYIGRTDILIT